VADSTLTGGENDGATMSNEILSLTSSTSSCMSWLDGDLSGIEYMRELTTVEFWYNNISDISKMAVLTKLTNLLIEGSTVSNINAVSTMKNLTSLQLSWSSIVDVSPIQNLSNLTNLDLNTNAIVDVTPLAGLTGLTILNLNSNAITTGVPSLSALTNATGIYLSNNAGIPCLELLGLVDTLGGVVFPGTAAHGSSCTGTPIAGAIASIPDANLATCITNSTGATADNPNAAYIYQITAITWASTGCDSTPFASLAGIEQFPRITTINIWGNGIADLGPLASLTRLTNMSMGFQPIVDVSPLQGLTKLTDLSLSDNQIVDVSPLSGLSALSSLNLRWNVITTGVATLTSYPAITGLSIDGNPDMPCAELTTLINAYTAGVVSPTAATPGTNCTSP